MTTTHLALPELTASQSQKHVTHNEALFFLDSIVQLAVMDKDLATPPSSPSVGDRYIVASGATGDWTGKGNSIAVWDGSGWIFLSPNDGWFAWVDDENVLYVFNGSWLTLASILGSGYLSTGGGTLTGNLVLEEATPSIRFNDTDITGYTLLQTIGAKFQISVDAEGDDANSSFAVAIDGSDKIEVNQYGLGVGGASADATNAFSFYGTNLLLNSGGSIDLKYNKNASGNDASMTFQTGFSTKALIGLLGNNDFTIKVGSGAATALVIDESTAAVEHTTHPKFSAYLNYGQTVTAGAWDTIPYNNERHDDQTSFNTGTAQFTAPHDGYYLLGASYTLENPGSSIPTEARIGLSLNGSAPTNDRIVSLSPLAGSSYAFGKVIGSTGSATVRGASVVRNSAGRYTITLDSALPSADYTVLATVTGVAGVYSDVKAVVESQAAGSLIINTLVGDNSNNADTAVDSDFFFAVIPAEDYGGNQLSLSITSLMKLSSGDTVEAQAFFVDNNGRIEADSNQFWGVQIA